MSWSLSAHSRFCSGFSFSCVTITVTPEGPVRCAHYQHTYSHPPSHHLPLQCMLFIFVLNLTLFMQKALMQNMSPNPFIMLWLSLSYWLTYDGFLIFFFLLFFPIQGYEHACKLLQNECAYEITKLVLLVNLTWIFHGLWQLHRPEIETFLMYFHKSVSHLPSEGIHGYAFACGRCFIQRKFARQGIHFLQFIMHANFTEN